MSSPSEVKDYGDWTVIYDDQNSDDHSSKKEERLADRRQTLARTLSIPKSMCILSDNKTEVSTVAELLSPRLKLPQLGTESAERVFPVRSVVSFDSTPSSALQTPSLDKLETPISPFSDTWTATSTNEQTSCQQRSPPGNGMNAENDASKRPDHLTQLHQKSYGGSGFSSVPKEKSISSPNPELLAQLRTLVRNGGDILDFHKTTKGIQYSPEDEEDIHIHSVGALVVMTENNGNFEVQIASDNSKQILGYSPDELFQLESFRDILPSSGQSNFLGRAQFVSSDDYAVERSGPEVFPLYILSSNGDSQSMWCTMHTSSIYKNYIYCELQPEAQCNNDHSEVENHEIQTENRSLDLTSGVFVENCTAPEKNLDSNSDSGMPDSSALLNTIPRVLQQLGNAQTLEALVQSTITTLQNLLRFDRTTIYHFDSDRNGIVVADAVDPTSGLASYEGMDFPESTFPEALKKLYTRNTVCSSFSGSQGTARLVYRASTNKRPLDMSNTYLSVATALPTPYTDNPVETCLSIQINVFGKLWGLVSCQSYDGSQYIHPLIQKVCWFMAEAVSSNIERLSYTLPFQFREPTVSMNKSNIPQAIKTPSSNLLSLFGADYAAASIMGEAKILGKPSDSQEVLALFEYMKAKENDTVFWSADIAADFQDLNYSRGFHHLSGLLYIPLSIDGRDFIIFFRAVSEKNNTASDPEKSSRQHEWSSADFGKASILSLLYRTFTDIWQEKEATMQNNQLMRLLLANSAHEFRTPLNAIINYLEIALDGSLDQETRDHISRSHSASKSLVYIINDLLDLTNAENGQRLIKDEVFNLSETLTEATDIFWEEARQKHVDLQVVQHAALPPVLGDQRRVRQVITNLISNAIQHTPSGALTIESRIIPELLEPGHISVEIAIHDTGSGMSQETVETLFCELEQVSNKGYMQPPKSYEGNLSDQVLETESVLGLGLALVARIVRNMNGQLSLKSEEGEGSCFKIRLEFPLPDEQNGQKPGPHIASKANLPEQEDKQGTKRDLTDESCVKQRKEDDIPCECGQTSEFESGPSIVKADVSLNTGESSNLSLASQRLDNTTHSDSLNSSRRTPDHTHFPEGFEPHTNEPISSSPINNSSIDHDPDTSQRSASPTMDWNLNVLIAEDDPTNSAILQKRLEKFGHSVYLTTNGKECASVYMADPARFHAVLMDLQMPIADGYFGATMIRDFERQQRGDGIRDDLHIPIFAVSASLTEKRIQTYRESGFDGWVMKPIDFQRVDRLLGGVRLLWVRKERVYQPGKWGEGAGWFEE
ncbi:hypothetical protein N7457_007965 [Penicillium paradoxum]|uniref:uncharacterized protein n=1 Tax=Penicillium paradoxum TaxID=176176 RepID=UPI002548A77D|nr:uncharacterized protein N7457_007965 [Penicillium paradoxum]KAJ5773069.1 hypothetical protein N7457_007965 [Penicillium paradoxum]